MEKYSPLRTVIYYTAAFVANEYFNTGHAFYAGSALNYQSSHPIVEVQYPDTPYFLKDSAQLYNYKNLVAFAEDFFSKLEVVPEKFDHLFKENRLSILA